MPAETRITAVLGPTNTGKTHYAIERMLCHRTGVIGLPLRLLAREVYDRIVRARGPSVVALVTGEERIVPDRTQYWVCTVEAMPEGMGVDFLAVDEIQLCADPERGHVFTDRLLHSRGLLETMFMGSETMRSAIAALEPKAQFIHRERFSTLTYTGAKKLSRMPERAAIVGFSVENVYAIAELLRRTKGGAAVVMGALSPRTRNAQVELYQNGDVDYLVATDAIGMGLNLDITHVAFSSLVKYDGARMRHLAPDELAQIAGRAGRHVTPGSFGVTGEALPLDDETIQAIENHRFRPVSRLQWRNGRLQFGSVKRLLQTLEERTDNSWLTRVRESDDLAALKALAEDAEVSARATDGPSVRLLWDVCRIPDFRGISAAEHASLLTQIYNYLHQSGKIPDSYLHTQISRIDRTDGDIDTLSKRLAFIRTWTYVAQRRGWVGDDSDWRDATRQVEDRLSDALHGALTQRFVDRRTSVLARRLKQKEVLVAEVSDKGDVTVEGEFVGRLEGFRFRMDKSASPDEARTLAQATTQALAPQFHLRADRFYNAPDTEIDFTEQGGLMWGEHAVGRLAAGPEPMKPTVVPFVDEDAGPEVIAKVQRRLQHFIDRKIAAAFEPLLALMRDETLTGLAKGFAYRMGEHFGIIPRGDIAEEVKALDQEARAALRKHGIRFGQFTVFQQPLLKPAPTRLRLLLWSLTKGLQEFPESPKAGSVTVAAAPGAVPGYYAMAGYRAAGDRAIRIDMLERLADLLRDKDSRAGFEAVPDMLSITGLGVDQFAVLMTGLGYKAEKLERPKVRAVKPVVAEPVAAEFSAEAPAAAEAVVELAAEAVEAVVEPAAEAVEAAIELAAEAVEAVVEPAFEPVPEPAIVVDVDAAAVPAPESAGVVPADVSTDVAAGAAPVDVSDIVAEPVADLAPVEMESYYSFTWAGRAAARRDRPHGQARPEGDTARPPRDRRPRSDRGGGDRGRSDAPKTEGTVEGAQDSVAVDGAPVADKPRGKRDHARKAPRDDSRYKPQPGSKPEGGDKPVAREERVREERPREDRGPRPERKPYPKRDDERSNKPQVFEARPARENQGRDKAIDMDNPFAAALAAFKTK